MGDYGHYGRPPYGSASDRDASYSAPVSCYRVSRLSRYSDPGQYDRPETDGESVLQLMGRESPFDN